MLSLLLLVVFALAAAVVWRFGPRYLDAQRTRLAAAALGLAGVVLAVAVLFAGRGSAVVTALDVMVEQNQGAVSYAFLVEQPGGQTLHIWPQPPAGGEVRAPLSLRVILTGPGNTSLINETVSVLTAEVEQERDGQVVRTMSWTAWSRGFQAPAEGIYQIALGLPPAAPGLQLRVTAGP